MNKKRLLSRFIKYVKVDSLSKQEAKFAKLIISELKKHKLVIKEDNAGKYLPGDCGNLYTVLKGNVKNTPRILLNAHLDTVVPGNNIKPKIKGNRVVTDGKTILGADNKAGVAVIMEVLDSIKEDNIPHGDIDIIFTVAEELGLCGAKFIDKKFLKADMGFVLDGGDIEEIINKAPSQDTIEVKIIGRAAHAGVRPEAGINAIQVAGIALSKIKLGRIDHETTANIGIINGGLATNIVPESVILKGEARSHNRDKLRRQVQHMSDIFHKTAAKAGAKVLFEVSPAYRSFEIEKGSLALKLALSAAKELGIRTKVKATGGGSDANIFNGSGLPCIILGVGADKVHTVQENCKIRHMEKGAELILNIIKETVKCSKKR
jgi:tripeptide aminopeptidase